MACQRIAYNVQGLLLYWYYITSSPDRKLNRITDNEVKNYRPIVFRQPEPLLIAKKKMSVYSSASKAADLMLGVFSLHNETDIG